MNRRWLTPLTVFLLVVLVVLLVSWYAFPGWSEEEGGFWRLVGIVITATLAILNELLKYIKGWNDIAKPDEKVADLPNEKESDSFGTQNNNLLPGVEVEGIQVSDKATMRELLLDALREQELREIVSDHYPQLYSLISNKNSSREIVAELIDFVFARRDVMSLLEIVNKYNPRQYQHHKQTINHIISHLNSDR